MGGDVDEGRGESIFIGGGEGGGVGVDFQWAGKGGGQ